MLVAYRDGELARRRAGKLAVHLERCAECRRELERLEKEFEQLVSLESAIPVEKPKLEQGLEALLEGLREWQLAQGSAVKPEVRERVAAQLRMFFGSRAADSVTKELGAERRHPNVLPMFAAFLGEKAAAVLASHAIEGIEFNSAVSTGQTK
jgi:anti-sigma factor RsiW